MTTLNISLPDDLKAFVEAQATAGGFASVSEYLGSVLREAQRRQARQALEAKLREAIASGPATPMIRENWEELERRVWERHHREHSPS